MAKILGIQFRINQRVIEQEQICLSRGIGEVDIDFINAFDSSIDWDLPEQILFGYQGVILGGSGDLDFDGSRPANDEVRLTSQKILKQLSPLLQYLLDKDIPTLGICFGHQILGAFAGACVQCDKKQSKTKSHEVKFVIDKSEHSLFSDLPDSFFAHYKHKDVLNCVPQGAVLLMEGGNECEISALQYKNNIYTVQFHPELTFLDMIKRSKDTNDYLTEGIKAEEVFKDDIHSNKILYNFGRLVAERDI